MESTRATHRWSPHVQHTDGVHTCNTQMESTRATHRWSPHVQHTDGVHTCNTQMESTRATHRCSPHVQHTDGVHTCNTQMESTRATHRWSPHVQHTDRVDTCKTLSWFVMHDFRQQTRWHEWVLTHLAWWCPHWWQFLGVGYLIPGGSWLRSGHSHASDTPQGWSQACRTHHNARHNKKEIY